MRLNNTIRQEVAETLVNIKFTTRNKAIAAWPEIEVFLPEPAVKNRAVVDVTKIREINSMLGLNQVSSAQGA